jgi:hypothetical protein
MELGGALRWTQELGGWRYTLPLSSLLPAALGLGLLVLLRIALRGPLRARGAPPAGSLPSVIGATIPVLGLALALHVYRPTVTVEPTGVVPRIVDALGPGLAGLAMALGLAAAVAGGALVELRGPGRARPAVIALLALALGLHAPLAAQLATLWTLPRAPILRPADPRPLHLGAAREVALLLIGAPPAGWALASPTAQADRAGSLTIPVEARHPHLQLSGEVALPVVADVAPEATALLDGGRWELVDPALGVRVRLRAEPLGLDGGLRRFRLLRDDPPLPADLVRDLALLPAIDAHRADGHVYLEDGRPLLSRGPRPAAGSPAVNGAETDAVDVLDGLPADATPCASPLLPELVCACGGPLSLDPGPLRCLQRGLRKGEAVKEPFSEAVLGLLMPGAGWDPVIIDLRRPAAAPPAAPPAAPTFGGPP